MVVDVLDLTDLHKRGLLKYAQEAPEMHSSDVLDLTQSSVPSQTTSAPSSSESSSALDFLSSFAQASASNVPSEPRESTPPLSAGHSDLHPKLDTILAKIEDTMYKLEMLSGRIARIETHLKQ